MVCRNKKLQDFLDVGLFFLMLFVSEDYIKALSLQNQKWKMPVLKFHRCS